MAESAAFVPTDDDGDVVHVLVRRPSRGNPCRFARTSVPNPLSFPVSDVPFRWRTGAIDPTATPDPLIARFDAALPVWVSSPDEPLATVHRRILDCAQSHGSPTLPYDVAEAAWRVAWMGHDAVCDPSFAHRDVVEAPDALLGGDFDATIGVIVGHDARRGAVSEPRETAARESYRLRGDGLPLGGVPDVSSAMHDACRSFPKFSDLEVAVTRADDVAMRDLRDRSAWAACVAYEALDEGCPGAAGRAPGVGWAPPDPGRAQAMVLLEPFLATAPPRAAIERVGQRLSVLSDFCELLGGLVPLRPLGQVRSSRSQFGLDSLLHSDCLDRLSLARPVTEHTFEVVRKLGVSYRLSMVDDGVLAVANRDGNWRAAPWLCLEDAKSSRYTLRDVTSLSHCGSDPLRANSRWAISGSVRRSVPFLRAMVDPDLDVWPSGAHASARRWWMMSAASLGSVLQDEQTARLERAGSQLGLHAPGVASAVSAPSEGHFSGRRRA